ncbi:MAG: TetR/AcrR family transcriptional regulator [Thermoanaerobacterales bacterium]|nr:TetR/AcrR family transcriptional regulator [Thermoanaerobacterales bacterium]
MSRTPFDPDKKRRVFDAAARLFARKGFEKTTVDEIAEAAEVAKGTVYYYFKGKEDLFLFLVEEGMAILKDRVRGAVRGEKDAGRALRRALRTQLRFFREYRDVCLIVLTEAWGTTARQEKLQQMIGDYYTVLEEIVDRGIAEGVLRARDSEVVCGALFGMTVMVALHFFRRPGPADWDLIGDELENILLRGLLSSGSGT